jgi:hypothetical protein
MDALKNVLGGNKAETSNSTTTSGTGLGGNANTAPAGQKDDYGDKGTYCLLYPPLPNNYPERQPQKKKHTDKTQVRQNRNRLANKNIPF